MYFPPQTLKPSYGLHSVMLIAWVSKYCTVRMFSVYCNWLQFASILYWNRSLAVQWWQRNGHSLCFKLQSIMGVGRTFPGSD